MNSFARIGVILLLLHTLLQTGMCEEFEVQNTTAQARNDISTLQEARGQLDWIESQHNKSTGLVVDAEHQTKLLEDFKEKVRDMPMYSDHNFGILLDLVRNISNRTDRSQALTYLYYEATEHNHIGTLNLIKLAKALSEKGQGYQFDRAISPFLFRKLLDRITAETTAVLVDVMKTGAGYQDNVEVKALTAGVADWRDVSEKVMTGLVSAVFDSVDTETILEAVASHTDNWQALVGMDYVLQRASRGNMSASFDVALHLNKTERSTNGTTPEGAKWRLQRIGEKLFIESVDHPGQKWLRKYMPYIASILHGWEPDEEFHESTAFTLEPNGPNCFLKNVKFKEYLYNTNIQVTISGSSTQKEWVYLASVKGSVVNNLSNYVWRIRKC